MMEMKIFIKVEEYYSKDELNKADKELLEEAIRASETSYSPYSSFEVGAAVRMADGKIIRGSNQENAAYPSGLCAERVALFYAQSQFPDMAIEAISIFARSRDFKLDGPVTPCGSCRQAMAEYENRHRHKMRVIMGNDHGAVQVVEGMDNLLPLMFMLEKLKKKGS
jgi:cytidine deaminase